MKHLFFIVLTFCATGSFAQDLICSGLNDTDCQKKIETSYNKAIRSMARPHIPGNLTAKTNKNEAISEARKRVPLSLYKEYLKDCSATQTSLDATGIFTCAKQKALGRLGNR